MLNPSADLVELLSASKGGDPQAFRKLVSQTYDELRRIGRSQLRGGSKGALETTVLVHEAFIKLATGSGLKAENEQHFYAIAARAMRQLVVDEVRARSTQKRGGGAAPLPLKTSIHLVAEADDEVLRLHEALERLDALEPDLARLVELRVFAGLTENEVAASLGISLRMAQRRWRQAKAWLAVALAD